MSIQSVQYSHFLLCSARNTAAFDYFKDELQPDDAIDVAAFESACGVGVVVTPEEICAAVKTAFEKNAEDIRTRRYRTNLGAMLAEVRKTLLVCVH